MISGLQKLKLSGGSLYRNVSVLRNFLTTVPPSDPLSGPNRMSRKLQDRINQLDICKGSGSGGSGTQGDEPHATHATRQKLQRPLAAPEKKVLSTSQLGQLQGTAEDLHDVITEAMSTTAFSDIFKGSKSSDTAVEIYEVKLNRDCSHAYISWKSVVLEQFTKEARKEFGDESAMRFVQRAVAFVNMRFQQREAQFRTYIIKHMHFRRVPRLFFSPWNPQLGFNFGSTGTGKKKILQSVLREHSGTNRSSAPSYSTNEGTMK